MTHKKKVCCIIPSLEAGGMERVMSELLTFFNRKNSLQIDLVLYGRNREIFYSIPEAIAIHKPEFHFDNRFRIFNTLKTILYIRKTIGGLQPESILSFGEYWNSFVLFALLGTHYPVYVSDRCSPEKKFGKLHSFLRKWLYPRAAGIIAQTEAACKIYTEELGHKNIKVIGNPIKVYESLSFSQRRPIVLSVGRLINSKHFDRLVRIFSKIATDDWRLVIIGGNALKQDGMRKLQDLINQMGLKERVELTGSIKDVGHYYSSSRIFAFTSSSEGFPNAVGEAMAAGLPVVAYDCVAGPSEIIKDGVNGFLIPLFNDELYAIKLQTLMSEIGVWNSMSAEAQKVADRFSIDSIGSEYLSFILG
jgi:glycosyltransferase involved in cell wall biosynthesis